MKVFPTCVGVFLQGHHGGTTTVRLPHVRGGVSSPEALWHRLRKVFPTCVGVFLLTTPYGRLWPRLPHVRGGVSSLAPSATGAKRSSPRAWGCFRTGTVRGWCRLVFPTCVGVFLTRTTQGATALSLPHVRGGVSALRGVMRRILTSSPRAWGCFCGESSGRERPHVFPTCVGVFPPRLPFSGRQIRSSPRAWGCFHVNNLLFKRQFVFPTCVGVFPFCPAPLQGLLWSSPRAWGCFVAYVSGVVGHSVFPTCVGVFPDERREAPF